MPQLGPDACRRGLFPMNDDGYDAPLEHLMSALVPVQFSGWKTVPTDRSAARAPRGLDAGAGMNAAGRGCEAEAGGER